MSIKNNKLIISNKDSELSSHNSLKWLNLNKFNIVYSFIKNMSSVNNINNNCLLIGSLLGNSYLEKNEKDVRIVFIKCSDNIEYLTQFYNKFRDIIEVKINLI